MSNARGKNSPDEARGATGASLPPGAAPAADKSAPAAAADEAGPAALADEAGAAAHPGRHRHLHATDLHGAGRLLLLAVVLGIDKVEHWHLHLLTRLGCGDAADRHGKQGRPGNMGKLGAFVYRQARGTATLAGRWIDRLAPGAGGAGGRAGQPPPLSSAQREAVLAALNGLFGDLLERLGNPLAIPMRLRHHGKPLLLERDALAAAFPGAGPRLVILIHGLCRSDLQWRRAGHDHGAALARDLGYTPLYLHYNSGRHVSVNGRELAGLLGQLVAAWPVPVTTMAIIGHSMGGLVARSACHYARATRQPWLRRLRHLVFLGTPHHGAPLERHGNWLGAVLGRSAITAPFARLGEMRSAGITDLRYGNLLDEDWHGRGRFEHSGDLRRKLPLPRGVRCYTIAGTTGRRTGDLRDRLLGDGLIPLDTALGRHPDPGRSLAFPRSRQSIAFGVHHLDLVSRREVYDTIRHWLDEGGAS